MIWLSVALAGGGHKSTQVPYAADDPDSHDLALYYASARQLPDNRLCGVAGSFEPTISWDDFDALIRQPWEACLRDDTDVLVVGSEGTGARAASLSCHSVLPISAVSRRPQMINELLR